MASAKEFRKISRNIGDSFNPKEWERQVLEQKRHDQAFEDNVLPLINRAQDFRYLAHSASNIETVVQMLTAANELEAEAQAINDESCRAVISPEGKLSKPSRKLGKAAAVAAGLAFALGYAAPAIAAGTPGTPHDIGIENLDITTSAYSNTAYGGPKSCDLFSIDKRTLNNEVKTGKDGMMTVNAAYCFTENEARLMNSGIVVESFKKTMDGNWAMTFRMDGKQYVLGGTKNKITDAVDTKLADTIAKVQLTNGMIIDPLADTSKKENLENKIANSQQTEQIAEQTQEVSPENAYLKFFNMLKGKWFNWEDPTVGSVPLKILNVSKDKHGKTKLTFRLPDSEYRIPGSGNTLCNTIGYGALFNLLFNCDSDNACVQERMAYDHNNNPVYNQNTWNKEDFAAVFLDEKIDGITYRTGAVDANGKIIGKYGKMPRVGKTRGIEKYVNWCFNSGNKTCTDFVTLAEYLRPDQLRKIYDQYNQKYKESPPAQAAEPGKEEITREEIEIVLRQEPAENPPEQAVPPAENPPGLPAEPQRAPVAQPAISQPGQPAALQPQPRAYVQPAANPAVVPPVHVQPKEKRSPVGLALIGGAENLTEDYAITTLDQNRTPINDKRHLRILSPIVGAEGIVRIPIGGLEAQVKAGINAKFGYASLTGDNNTESMNNGPREIGYWVGAGGRVGKITLEGQYLANDFDVGIKDGTGAVDISKYIDRKGIRISLSADKLPLDGRIRGTYTNLFSGDSKTKIAIDLTQIGVPAEHRTDSVGTDMTSYSVAAEAYLIPLGGKSKLGLLVGYDRIKVNEGENTTDTNEIAVGGALKLGKHTKIKAGYTFRDVNPHDLSTKKYNDSGRAWGLLELDIGNEWSLY